MKIDTINPMSSVGSPSSANPTQSAETGNDFAALLEGEMQPSSTDSANLSQETAFPLEHFSAVSNALLLSGLENNTSDEEGAMETLEETLDGLEDLNKLLEDQQTTPRNVDTAFRNLSETIPRLQEQTAHLPEDHPLRQMGDELSVLVAVESIKWNRGDYL